MSPTMINATLPPMTLIAKRAGLELSAGGTIARIRANSVIRNPVPPTKQQLKRPPGIRAMSAEWPDPRRRSHRERGEHIEQG